MFQAPGNREPKPLLRRQTRFLNEVRVAKRAPEATWLPRTSVTGGRRSRRRRKQTCGVCLEEGAEVASAGQVCALGGFCPMDTNFEISPGCAMAVAALCMSFFARWENSGNSSKKMGSREKTCKY